MSHYLVCPNCRTNVATITPIADAEGERTYSGSTRDVVGEYLAERTVKATGALLPTADLRADFDAWAATRDVPALSARALGTAVRGNGVQPYRSNGVRYYAGIALRK